MDIISYLGGYTDCFTYLGVGVAAYITCIFAHSLWSAIRAYCWARVFDIGPDLKNMGTWAVITGSTDGIGNAYAHELARRGINIVLISRSAEKLERVAKEIEVEYHVQTKRIAVDFTTPGMGIYEKIKNELEGMEVGILVNNVGMAFFPECIQKTTDPKGLMDVVSVNCQSVVQMTLMVLPQMVARKKGVMINISSVAGLVPVPFSAVYSASKAFVDHFTDAVQFETRGSGVVIQLVRPFYVATNMIKRSANANFWIPSPAHYVRAAIATIGLQDKTVGCLSHVMQSFMFKLPKTWIQYGCEVAFRKIASRAKAAALIETKNK